MANLPVGLYFIRTPNGPSGPEYHIRLEDDRWSASENMVPFIDDAYLQAGIPIVPNLAPYFVVPFPNPSPFGLLFGANGAQLGSDVAYPTTFSPPLPAYDFFDYTTFYKISKVKRIGRIPVNSLALSNQPFEKTTYKNAMTGGVPSVPFRSMPVLNFDLNLFPSYADDPVFHSDFPIYNALDRDTLFDDDGNTYFPDAFWQPKGGIVQAWIYQELLGSNLPTGNGTDRWRWKRGYSNTVAGPYIYDILSSGSFSSSNTPVGLPASVLMKDFVNDGDPSHNCTCGARLEYSPDGVSWPSETGFPF